MTEQQRKIIFNADDFGLDDDTFIETRSLLESGMIMSATILVGMPATAAAINYARKHQSGQSFGLHFNIAEWHPPSGRPRPTLTDKDGQFNKPIKQRILALAGALNGTEIAAELEYQLSILRDSGLNISHVDSHGHLHKYPSVVRAMFPVLRRFGVGRLRIPQTHYDNPRFYNQALDRYCMRAFHGRSSQTANFFNTRSHNTNWLDQFLERLPQGTTEIGIHPGRREAWRKVESQGVTDAGKQQLFEKFGVANISYLEI